MKMQIRSNESCRPGRMIPILLFAILTLSTAGVLSAQQPTVAGRSALASHSSAPPSGTINFSSQDSADYGTSAISDADGTSALATRVAELEAQVQSLQISAADQFARTPVFQNGCAGFYFGAAAVWAKPHFKEAFQHSRTNLATGQQTLVPFNYDYEATPRIWLGFRNSRGMGLRATYWNFDATGTTSTNTADGINLFGAHAVTVIFPANIFAAIPGSTLTNQDSLEAQITNVYATYDMSLNDIKVSGGVGVRYARLLQSLSSVVSGPQPASLTWTRQYDGVGPAVDFDLSKRIACSRFSGVAHGSGSFLFGTKRIDRTVLGDMSPQPASPFLTLEEADEVVGIGEFGFGLEWATANSRGTELALRGTYEGQLWAEAGAPTLGFLGFEAFGFQAEIRR